MNMFENIVFDEFTILEGQQAEEYKKRKAEEELHKNDQGSKRFKASAAKDSNGGSVQDIKDQIKRRSYIGDKITGSGKGASIHHHSDGSVEILSDVGNKMTKDNPNNSILKNKLRKDIKEEDRKRADKVDSMVWHDNDDGTKTSKYSTADKYSLEYQKDAANRHIRRHPKQYKESTFFDDIEMI